MIEARSETIAGLKDAREPPSQGMRAASAAAATKSLQLRPTLCDPIDGSPPGSPIPGILQARTPEWVAISFPSAWKWKVKVKLLNRVQLVATPWTAAHQAPPSMGFFNSGIKNKIFPFAASWLDIEDIMLKWNKSHRERQRQIPYSITYIWNLKYDTNELTNKIETLTDIENRLIIAKRMGRDGVGIRD